MTQYGRQEFTEESSKTIAFLNDKMGEDILQANYSKVITKFSQLDIEQKKATLAVCISALSGEQSKRNKHIRIAAVRVIVALLPMSLGAVTSLLSRFLNKHHYEVHFTLFCYLDWAQEMPDASALTKDVLRLMENYLLKVPRKTALAAWMAADMLGEHWNEQEAAPLLIKTAQTAKYSVGRQFSIMGLEGILGRLPRESGTHRNILKIVRKISLPDHSEYVKKDAKAVLKHWRKAE